MGSWLAWIFGHKGNPTSLQKHLHTHQNRKKKVQVQLSIQGSLLKFYWTIYSAITFLERCRKVVREIWFEKSGSKNLVQEKWLTREKGGFIP